jgi:hypothetical protein
MGQAPPPLTKVQEKADPIRSYTGFSIVTGHAPILGRQTLENADDFSGTRTAPWY